MGYLETFDGWEDAACEEAMQDAWLEDITPDTVCEGRGAEFWGNYPDCDGYTDMGEYLIREHG